MKFYDVEESVIGQKVSVLQSVQSISNMEKKSVLLEVDFEKLKVYFFEERS